MSLTVFDKDDWWVLCSQDLLASVNHPRNNFDKIISIFIMLKSTMNIILLLDFIYVLKYSPNQNRHKLMQNFPILGD